MGSGIIQENLGNVKDSGMDEVFEKTRKEVFQLVRQTLRPEFLNRIDELVMFSPLTQDHLDGIIRLQLDLLRNILLKQNITFETTERCIDYLSKEGYDIQFGARPLKRLMQKKILDGLSIALLEEKIAPGMHIEIDVEGQQIVFHGKEAGKPELAV